MPEHHKVLVVRIAELLPHPNADSLSIVVPTGSYQCVVRTEEYKAGDLAVYIPPDSIVPQIDAFKFLWSDREYPDGIVPEKHRRVTVRRFRKAWSEGLLMPLTAFSGQLMHDENMCYGWLKEGDDVSELLGVTHYVEPEPVENINGKRREQYKTWPPRSLKGFFYWFMYKLGFDLNGPLGGDAERPPKNAPPVYDVESFKHYPRLFEAGEEVIVTEKIHGSCFRAFFDGKKMWVGSKNLWKSEKSTCIWRRALKELPWIEEFCRAYPNYVLYAEVVPTQPGYTYGTEEGRVKVFAFDVLHPDGTWVDKKDLLGFEPLGLGLDRNLVPLLSNKTYDEAEIKTLVEGPSRVPGSINIREGIVICSATERKVRGVGRAQLKLKSMAFMEKEGKK